jgi:hypothetical protein
MARPAIQRHGDEDFRKSRPQGWVLEGQHIAEIEAEIASVAAVERMCRTRR